MNAGEFKHLVDKIREHLKPILDESGAVFYSGRQTLEGKTDFYLMGLNPGGAPDVMKEETIKRSLSDWQGKKPDYWSEYRDAYWGKKQQWTDADNGNSRHQKWVRDFCADCLGEDVRNVFSANAIFKRTKKGVDLPKGTNVDDICWQVHKLLFSKVQPKYIICLGHGSGSPFERLKQKQCLDVVGPHKDEPFKMPNGKRSFYIRSFEAAQIQNKPTGLDRLVRVIGVPHPSWFPLGANWFREAWEKLSPLTKLGVGP
ncbi:MAG: hypothetical protein KF747_18475 [Nitrospira sp.]|nr:hypothetical protein [Nitrospira sp.]